MVLTVLCATRHSNSVNVLEVTRQNQDLGNCDKKNIDLLQQITSSTDLSSVALSPYIEGELATCNETGVLEIHRIDQKFKHEEISKCEHRFTCNDTYWMCNWGMHPRQITVTDRTGVAIYDARTSKAKVSDLFALPHSIFSTKERLFMCKPHPVKSYYHVLVTDHSFVLADQRFPNHPVIHWKHLMQSPPVYVDVCPNVVCGINGVSEDLVLLGNQSKNSEVHCFQLIPVNHPGLGPALSDVPWKLSSM